MNVGFEDAPLTTSQGPVMRKDVRNNDRVMIDDPDRSDALYRRLAPHFRRVWGPVGLNERLRLYRYDPGQLFDWHHDRLFRAAGRRAQLLHVHGLLERRL
jgi:hypothetical protein